MLAVLPGGVTRHLEISLSALPGSGQPTGSSAVSSVRNAAPELLLSLRDVTTLRRAQAKLRHDASHDGLTGLLNRSGLRAALGQVTAAQTSGMVACLDIDGFGGLNAALSRTAGDLLLLIQVAARLNDLAELEGGQAARLADDTFAVYLPQLGAAVGARSCKRRCANRCGPASGWCR
ncbi:GGDEF domain-containing protein [Deinococcus sp. PESE-38]